jgi:hypothetical protein
MHTSTLAQGLAEIGFILDSSLAVSCRRILGEILEMTMTNNKESFGLTL